MNKLSVNKTHEFEIDPKDFGALDLEDLGNGKFHLLKDGKSINIQLVQVDREEKKVKLQIQGVLYTVDIKDRMTLLLEKMGMGDLAASKLKDLKAPMPGLVLEIKVKPGDEVQKGDPLMILEAMKMENMIKAQGNGKVQKIEVNKGDAVEKDQLLIAFA